MMDLDLTEAGRSQERSVHLPDDQWETMAYVLDLAQVFLMTHNRQLRLRLMDVQNALRDQGVTA
jgi:hypothetical protein